MSSAAKSSKAILVTGAAGFIGGRFVESCGARGIGVISVDCATAARDHFRDRTELHGLDFGRIVDLDALPGALDEGSISPSDVGAVMHLGACTDTLEMDEELLRRVNLEYSQRLFRWCTRHRVPLVYASSAATYGAGEHGWVDDESLIPGLRPLNPYGWSKQRFDLWALDEERAGRTPPTWVGLKFFNVYGFGERHKGRMASVILHAYDQINSTGKVKLFKSHRPDFRDGEQRRDFVAVEDVVDVLHFAAGGRIPRGIFNLGSGVARTFLDLARATFTAMGARENIELIDMPIELRERYQYSTCAQMQRLRGAGWQKPFTTLEEGAARYVKRLRAHEASV